MFPAKYRHVKIALLCLSLTLLYITFSMLRSSKESFNNCPQSSEFDGMLYNLPVVKIFGIQEKENTLDVVKKSFKQAGYHIAANSSEHWDILWSHSYPFYSLRNDIADLKPYQKINHFPGSGYITQKSNLIALPINAIPKSFILPSKEQEFLDYAQKNIDTFWVLKSSNHRGIKIINGIENLNIEGAFIQKFIKNPLLISGKKFDIGIYVVITSIDPLRVYMYSGDILLRFCKKNYFPLDVDAVESYVVSDDYLPIWDIPDLKVYYSELNYTAKESLNAYLRFKGKSTNRLWSQIVKVIQEVFYNVEEKLKSSALPLGSLRNYFELVRFDFIVDDRLSVHLLEINMSPNLSPAHFPENRLLYEQVVFNTFSVVGLIRKFHDIFFYRGEIEVSEKDIQVSSEQCASVICQKSCQNLKCKVCNQCMTKELKEIFKSAHLEFTNRGKFRRVIPPPISKTNDLSSRSAYNLTEMNSYMDLWFKGKCLQDSSWC